MSRKAKPKHKLSCKTTWRRMQGCRPVIANNQRKKMTYPFDVSYDLLDKGEGFEQTLTSHKAWYHKYCKIKLARAVQNPETNSSICQEISPHEQIQCKREMAK